MSYQKDKGVPEGYPPPGYAQPYQPSPYPPPGYSGPTAPGYPQPPPPPPPDYAHCCHHGPPQAYQQGYQGYFNQGYPPQQYPPPEQYLPPEQYASPGQGRPGYTSCLEGCLAALCCCFLLEECCP